MAVSAMGLKDQTAVNAANQYLGASRSCEHRLTCILCPTSAPVLLVAHPGSRVSRALLDVGFPERRKGAGSNAEGLVRWAGRMNASTR